MRLRNLILTLVLFLAITSPTTASANNLVSVTKSVSPSTLKNICEDTTVEIKVKGADQSATVRKKLDIVLVMDHSYSMFEYNDGRMGASQAAATTFIDELDPNFDIVGLVRFSTNAELQENLTDNYNPVKNTINGYFQDGFEAFTNIEDALDKGISEIENNGRSDATKLVILFSDGGVNRPLNGGTEDIAYAKGKALDKANDAGSKNIIVYTVTLGTSNLDIDLMDDIADATGGKSFVAPNPQDIVDAYLQIASEITNSVASNIKVTDVINKDFIFVNGSDSPVANITANPDGSKTLKWNIGVLKSNQEVTFKYKVSPKDDGSNQAIDSNPLSKVEFIDVNGDAQTIIIPSTKISVKSDDCGRGGGNGDDDEDEDDNDDEDEDSDDDNDGRGSVLGSSHSRISSLPVTGAVSNLLFSNKCENSVGIQLLLLAQAVLHVAAIAVKGGKKYQAVIALLMPAAIFAASYCVSPVLVVSIIMGAGFIFVARIFKIALLSRDK